MNLLTKDMMPELLSVNEEPAYHYICPRTVLTLTIFRIRYYLKPFKKLKQSLLKTFRVRSYNTAEAFVA
jgi:hypothetical protein